MFDFDHLDQARKRVQGPSLGNAYASDSSTIYQFGNVSGGIFYNFESTSINQSSHPWTIPRGVNRLFTGRQEILDTLTLAFCRDDSSNSSTERRFVIAGIGGTGKSEICIKFAVDHRNDYWGIFWVDCATGETAEESFKRIANVCGIKPGVENVKSWLSSTRQRWLLIIDNADDIKVTYSAFFPVTINGDIIITTRNPELCKKYATVGSEQDLPQLTSSLAEELLLRAAGISEKLWSSQRAISQNAVKELGYHTLAILHTGAYIVECGIDIEEYTQIFQQQREQQLKTIIFETTRDQEHGTYETVNLTFEISVQRIEALGRNGDATAADALELLDILAFLHYEGDIRMLGLVAGLYIDQLNPPANRRLGADFFGLSASHADLLPQFYMRSPQDLTRKVRWNKACGMLAAFSFVKIGEENKAEDVPGFDMIPGLDRSKLIMHPLVHAWARQRQDIDKQRCSWLKAVTTLAFVCREGLATNEIFWMVQTHTDFCLSQDIQQFSNAAETPIVAPLLWVLLMIQADLVPDYNTREMIDILHGLVQQENEKGNIASEDANLAKSNLLWMEGKWMHRQGQLFGAVKQLENVTAVLEGLLEEDHPATIATKGDLSSAYRANGQLDQAILSLKDIIRIRGHGVGEDHSTCLDAQRELATVYSLSGQHNEAVEILENVVDVQKKLYPETHPSLMLSEQSLALTYTQSPDSSTTEKAVELLENIVNRVEHTHKKSHRQRLVYQYSLGVAYTSAGKYDEAISILELVQKERQKLLEEDNPQRLASDCCLANAYLHKGQANKAIPMLERLVVSCGTTWPENHFQRLAAEMSLGFAYMKARRNIEACNVFQHVVDVRERFLTQDHLDLLEAQWALAKVYRYQRNFKEATRLLKHVIRVEEGRADFDKERLLLPKDELCKIYLAKNNKKKAWKVARDLEVLFPQK